MTKQDLRDAIEVKLSTSINSFKKFYSATLQVNALLPVEDYDEESTKDFLMTVIEHALLGSPEVET